MGELREPLQQLAECGLPAALEAMGERWSFMILRAAFNGVRHFEEFLSEISIARNILANRLTRRSAEGRISPDRKRARPAAGHDRFAPMGRKMGHRCFVQSGVG